MKIASLWLAPLSLLYGIGVGFRNYLFNIGYSRSFNYDIMVIATGNLSVGGTGKSPMTEYLIRLLHRKYSLATLSRGYKRKTKGFLMADEYTGVREIGDEPYQMYLKYGKVARVGVGEERSIAIPNILLEHPETQVILMDDGYQHRTVRPDFSILLTDYHHLFTRDHLLPWGRLREPKGGAKRAQVIIVTKCPDRLDDAERNAIHQKIEQYTKGDTPIFFSRIVYSKPLSLTENGKSIKRVIAFAGLAKSDLFEEYIRSNYTLIEMITFSDHHYYTDEDVKNLVSRASDQGADLITTEKDIVKFRSKERLQMLKGVSLYYLAIEHKFLKYGNVFDKLVNDAIEEKYNSEEDERN